MCLEQPWRATQWQEHGWCGTMQPEKAGPMLAVLWHVGPVGRQEDEATSEVSPTAGLSKGS